jgi:hypothetical protein
VTDGGQVERMSNHPAHGAPPSEHKSISATRVGVSCAACGGPAVATIALVSDGRNLVAEELCARCPRCGDLA